MYRVILVDDEELVLISLQHAFPWKKYGFSEIITTTDSGRALRILADRKVDAALVDISMPEINGLELIAKAKEIPIDTCFVVVSGYADFSFAKRAIKLDVLDYCLKPVMPEETEGILKKIFGTVLTARLRKDPLLFEHILDDDSFCCCYLVNELCLAAEKSEIVLMTVCMPDVHKVLLDIGQPYPKQILHLSTNEAVLIWTDVQAANGFLTAVEQSNQPALLICTSTEGSVPAFQSALMQLRMECNSKRGENGIHWISPINSDMSNHFARLLSFVQENYHQKMTLRELADKYSINYSYLSQIFKKIVGVSFPEYLTNIRLERACTLLADSSIKIVNIAENVGFSDYHYFCKVFKQNVGVSPSQYRHDMRKERDIQ